MRTTQALLLAIIVLSALAALPERQQISADIGPCTAQFTVTDAAHKPVYDAKIHTVIRYGFMSKRKMELEIGTDADGKAKFLGLPHEVKKPLEFGVSYKELMTTVTLDPAVNCQAVFDVVLAPKR